ncbi:MAG TPA: PQQ-binding-like beta-propeller repeat protein [Thermoleophilaceae bacterium]|nr:PQQ-binding-like beta-propeller repeat protein [Thermoleophilaceae bacterium]
MSRLPRWAYVVIAVGVLAAGGLTVWLVWGRAPEDVSNPDAEFTVPDERPKPKKPKPENFVWPIFGYTPDRAKYFETKLGPPFKEKWRFRADSLLEFPPVLSRKTLFFVTNRATAVAVNAETGKRVWQRRVGSLSAASPAWSDGKLYVVTLDGRLTVLRGKDGKVLWKKDLPSRTESSPLILGKRVFFGSEDGTVYALKAGNGKTIWTYQAPGAVKAGLAYSDGRLFFGDYAGVATAIRARDGKQVWDTQSAGLSLGRSGTFYSTPAVAFGRVYMGNTDGRVYSFTARSGDLAWTQSTGAYVYSGPAAANVGAGPTVFIGSYTGRFYAFDARSGAERWSYQSGGRISGAVSVIGDVVYFADIDTNDTQGLDVRTGKRVFHLDGIGGYAPPISDGEWLYVTGHSRLLGFQKGRKRERPPKRR